MSFGEGNLHERVERLAETNGYLCAEINRQQERIEDLDELVRDLYADLMEYGCTPNAHKANYKPRFEALGIEVER